MMRGKIFSNDFFFFVLFFSNQENSPSKFSRFMCVLIICVEFRFSWIFMVVRMCVLGIINAVV
jgi:hypothetical protein